MIREQEHPFISLRDFLNILFKQKFKILVVFFAIVIPVTVITWSLPSIYEAKSRLMVKFGREHIYRPEVGEANATFLFDREQVFNSEVYILTSRDLKEKVLTTLGMETVYPDLVTTPANTLKPPEAAINRFGRNLSAEILKKSNIIQVSFKHEDPQVAARVVNLLVDFYKEKHLQIFSDSRSSFLEKQLADYRQKLKESENNLEAFKKRYGVFSLDQQMDLLLKQRVELDTSVKASQNRIKELKQKLSSLENQIQTIDKKIPVSTETERFKIIDDAKAKLLELQLKEQQLLRDFKESSRMITSLREEMKVIRDFLDGQQEYVQGRVTTGENRVYQEVESEIIKTKAELSSWEAQSGATEQQLIQLDGDIQALSRREKAFQNLKREQATHEKNYQTYLAKLEEARISEDMDRQKIANISVIQAATVPVGSIKPQRSFNIALGIILATFTSLGLAFLSEYIGQGLSTPESVEKYLNLPVLATISHNRYLMTSKDQKMRSVDLLKN
jgi:uncharacterized protein involved in exopolysaccharide biosynthesis